ncbi:MAG: DegT/DnrJ/EryC1/StrS family aminotransferase [Myxococcota bacterium]
MRLAINGGRPIRKRPFPKWPHYDKSEERYLLDAFHSHNWGGFPSPNKYARLFAEKFASYHGAKYGICAANGTVTLEVALRAAGVTAGDEVIVPALTWTATALAAVYINAIPVFADIDPETYCIDPDDIERKITKRTKAIIPVHLGSNIADMDRIMQIARRYKLIVIEDCAHAHGGFYNNKGVGSIGDFGSFSFQTSKLMTAGEGGIILTSNKEYAERCHSLINCGRKEKGYDSFKGYMTGWNYRISDLQAAVLLGQMTRLEKETIHREKMANYLSERLSGVPGILLLKRDKKITRLPMYEYLFRFIEEDWYGVTRDAFVSALSAEGIPCEGDFYIPLYQNPLVWVSSKDYPMIRRVYGDNIFNSRKFICPVSEYVAYHESVWLHASLFMGSKSDIDDIADAIEKIRENITELRDSKNIKVRSRWRK